MTKCGNCIYYDNKDICYRKGTRVVFNNNICEYYVNINNYEGEHAR